MLNLKCKKKCIASNLVEMRCNMYLWSTNVKQIIMASRRNLKKDINYVIGDLFTECLIYKELIPGSNQEAADDLMIDLLKMDSEFITRISHTEPGAAKQYYRTFYKDFSAALQNIADKLNSLKK